MRISSKMLGLAAVLSLASAPLFAQFNIPINNWTDRFGGGSGGGIPYTYATTNSPSGVVIEDFQPASWMEWNVQTDVARTPGLYKISMLIINNQDPSTQVSFEVRKLTTPTDPQATYYSTGPTKNYGRIGTDYWVGWQTTDAVDANDAVLTVPIYAGQNVFRIQSVAGRLNPANSYPTDLSDPNNRPWGDFWSNLRVGAITLTRVGDLPATRTVTGKVSGDRPAGIGVKSALVMAAPTGGSVAEPSWWWKNGYTTLSKDDGTYALTVPIGSWEVKAGRPSCYEVQGSAVQTLPASGDATANMSLTNIFQDDGAGSLVAYVQNEYRDQQNGRIGLLPVDGQNGFKMGWVDANDYCAMLVDAPQAGMYEMTSSYFNGGANGNIRISTDLGSATTAIQAGNGNWGGRQTVTYPNKIYLVQGPNLVYQTLISGNSDQDALNFRLTNEVPKVGQVKGVVTNSLTGLPIAGATITLGTNIVTTGADGKYSIIANEGANQVINCTAPYADANGSKVVSVTAGGVVLADFALVIRPNVSLSTANGNYWLWTANVGGTVDYSAVTVDDSLWQTITVPSSWENLIPEDDIYGWYRLHFTVPADFNLMPGRMVRFTCPQIDDTDVTFLNGTQIGANGKMPNPPLGVQPAGHINPPAGGIVEVPPGAQPTWNAPRNYYFPASLLKTGDNVLAIKVWDMNAGAGLNAAAPVLEIAPATGSINGTVKAGGVGVPGFRVTAMTDAGVSSDTAVTDATGAFTLSHVFTGITTVGAVKPGYNPVIAPVGNIIEGGAVNGLALTTAAVAGGAAAPVYDDFNGTGTAWEAKWTAQSLLSTDPLNAPSITMPGVDVNAGRTEIPGTLTIDGGLMARAALLSKATQSRFASVVSARLVSALPAIPEPTGTIPNVILYISGQGVDAANWTFVNQMEFDLEGYQTTGGAQRVRIMIWASTSGDNRTLYPIDIPLERLNDVTPTNPVEMTIARTGNVYDFFINNILSFSCVGNVMPDHRFAMYSYPTASSTTWDYVLASGMTNTTPVAGDLNGNGFVDAADSILALQIAGGLLTATPAQVTTGNVAGGDNAITILDAVRLQQAANGRPL